jgi:biotin carboxyl carrier protein
VTSFYSAERRPLRQPRWLGAQLIETDREGGEIMAEEIRAPLDGTVLSVLVEPGAKVDVDDELLIIEAMKMQNMVYAPCAGAVTIVNVKAGDRIEAGDLLLVID